MLVAAPDVEGGLAVAEREHLRATDEGIALARSAFLPKLSVSGNIQENIGQISVDNAPYEGVKQPQWGVFLHFELGFSYYSGASVKSLIFNRLPATVSLAIGGAIVWLVTGLTIGIISARRAGSWLDFAQRLARGSSPASPPRGESNRHFLRAVPGVGHGRSDLLGGKRHVIVETRLRMLLQTPAAVGTTGRGDE